MIAATAKTRSASLGVLAALCAAAALLAGMLAAPQTAQAADYLTEVRVDASTIIYLDEEDEVVPDTRVEVVGAQPGDADLTCLTASFSWQKQVGEAWVDVEAGRPLTAGTYRPYVTVTIDPQYDSTYIISSAQCKVIIDNRGDIEFQVADINSTRTRVGFVNDDMVFTISGELGLNDAWSIEFYPSKVGASIGTCQLYGQGGTLTAGSDYEYAKVSGPSWLDVSSSGQITGTPAMAGTNKPLVVRIYDSTRLSHELPLLSDPIPVPPTYSDDTTIDEIDIQATSARVNAPYRNGNFQPQAYAVDCFDIDVTESALEAFTVEAVWQKRANGEWVDVLAAEPESARAGYYRLKITITDTAGTFNLFDTSVVHEYVGSIKMGDYYDPDTTEHSVTIYRSEGEYAPGGEPAIVDVAVPMAGSLVENQPMTPVQLEAVGFNVVPCTFSIEEGPSWLSISPSGLLKGTPPETDDPTSVLVKAQSGYGTDHQEATLRIPVGRVYAADARTVHSVEAIGADYLDSLAAGGRTDSDESVPVKLDGVLDDFVDGSMYWQKLEDDVWTDPAHWGEKASIGTYRPIMYIDGRSQVVFGDDVTTVTVDGEEWPVVERRDGVILAAGEPVAIETCPLSKCTIDQPNSPYYYDGDPVPLWVTVTGPAGETLVENVDYTLTYTPHADAGIWFFNVTGKGSYFGERQIGYVVKPANIAGVTQGTVAAHVYDGNPYTPLPKLSYNEYPLKANVDYVVDNYTNNTEIGTGVIEFTGSGNFTGSDTQTFQIIAAPVGDNTELVSRLSVLTGLLDDLYGLEEEDLYDTPAGVAYITATLYQDALYVRNNAEDVANNPASTQAQIDYQRDLVNSMINNIAAHTYYVPNLNLIMLEGAVAAADALLSSDLIVCADDAAMQTALYEGQSGTLCVTQEAHDALVAADAAAHAKLDYIATYGNTSQKQVDGQTIALDAAISAFDDASQTVPDPDTTALDALRSQALSLRQTVTPSADGSDVPAAQYWAPVQLVQVFDSAYADAAGPFASQKAVHDAWTALNIAMHLLNSNKQHGTQGSDVDVQKAVLSDIVAAATEMWEGSFGTDDDPSTNPETFYGESGGVPYVPTDVYAELEAALEAANTVLDDPAATYDDVRAAQDRLTEAMSEFNAQAQYVPYPDMTALYAALDEAQALLDQLWVSTDGSDILADQWWVTQSVYDDLAYEISDKGKVDIHFSQMEVDSATQYVVNATNAALDARRQGTLPTDYDRTSLANALERANAAIAGVTVVTDISQIDELAPGTVYTTQDAYDALAALIADAQAKYDDPAAKSLDLRVARVRLLRGLADFEGACSTVGDPDKGALEALHASGTALLGTAVVSADGTDVESYDQWVTQAQHDALASALAAAQAAIDDDTLSRAQVDQAVTALQSAIDAFEAAKQPGTKAVPTGLDELMSLIAQVNALIANTTPVTDEAVDVLHLVPGTPYVPQALYDAMVYSNDSAKAVVADSGRTDDQVNYAIAWLTGMLAAYDGNVKTAPVSDASALEAAIAAGQAALGAATVSLDGSDVPSDQTWVTQNACDKLGYALTINNLDPATHSAFDIAMATDAVQTATQAFIDSAQPGTQDVVVDMSAYYAIADQVSTELDNLVASSDGSDVPNTKNWVTQSQLDSFISRAQDAAIAPGRTQDEVDACTLALTQLLMDIKAAEQPGTKVWNRLWGNTALDTMARIVDEGWAPGSADTVIVATMSGYYDALAAGSLAGAYNAPILLTSKGKLADQTRDEIERLGASHVIIVGGNAAVADTVDPAIEGIGCVTEVRRVQGKDAQETALLIAAESVSVQSSSTCIVATSKTYQDALAIAPYSYSSGAPIYLTNAKGALRADVAQAIEDGNYDRIVIVGGNAAIPDSTQAQLERLVGKKNVTRLWGNDAIQTAAKIAQWCVDEQGMSANKMGVATAGGYHDALAGAALCGRSNSVLILVNKAGTNFYGIDNFVKVNKSQIDTGYIFGGASAVNANVEAKLEQTTK